MIIDYHAEVNPIEKIKEVLPKFDLVGISIYSESIAYAKSVAKTVKEKDAEIPIIIGGPHCLFFPEKALEDIPEATISVDGEGERTIIEILEAFQGKKELSKIGGIHYREKDKIKEGKKQSYDFDINQIPFPPRHLVSDYDYGRFGKFYFFKPKFTTMLTSRGCPFKCRFCGRNISSMNNFRMRSADNVIDEFIKINEQYNSVMIVDDNFLADKKRAHLIFDGIIENDIDLELYIQGARVDSAERELYKKMKKSGVKHLYFGLESGNQDVLDYYRKGITIEQIRKALRLSKEMNFLTLGNFILGAPIETKEHIKNTIKFAKSLPLDFVIFNPLSYQRGSDLWKEAFKNGIINEFDEPLADSRLGLSNFTSDELEDFCKQAVGSFYFRPMFLLRQAYRVVKDRDFNFLKFGLNNLL
jgi:radical SAM superfamily enzyme YgiQ (UPF0313 family)